MKIENNALLSVNGNDITDGAFVVPDDATSIEDSVFSGRSDLKSIIIPNSVTSIGDDVFYFCSGLKSIAIPDSVMSMGDDVFYRCSGLKSIVIPNSVANIGDDAFCLCSGLTSVIIPNSVISIGDSAFGGCSSLKSIAIPDSVSSIGSFAFEGCISLEPYANKNEIIDLALELLPNSDGFNRDSLCVCLDEATRIVSMRAHRAISVQSTFPLFTHTIAIEMFGGMEGSSWWPTNDKASRIAFLEYLRTN